MELGPVLCECPVFVVGESAWPADKNNQPYEISAEANTIGQMEG